MGPEAGRRVGSPELRRQIRYASESRRHLVEDLKRGLGGLATIGSVAPFVGLFGTTIGIINAFQGMRIKNVVGIEAVAGGIAEALVTTAFGLFV
ncbi:MAG: flagellar motor protein MotA, partial [Acidobacteria bacterium]